MNMMGKEKRAIQRACSLYGRDAVRRQHEVVVQSVREYLAKVKRCPVGPYKRWGRRNGKVQLKLFREVVRYLSKGSQPESLLGENHE